MTTGRKATIRNPIQRKFRLALGMTIKALREAAGLHAWRLGSAVGVGEVCEHKRESGELTIPADDIPVYAMALGVSAEEIVKRALVASDSLV